MINVALELNTAIKDTSEAKEYFNLKKAIANDDSLMKLLDNIEALKKEANKALKDNNISLYRKLKIELELLNNELLSNPLVSNYLESKRLFGNLLEQVANILSE